MDTAEVTSAFMRVAAGKLEVEDAPLADPSLALEEPK